MLITYKSTFVDRLANHLEYIARYNPKAAKNLQKVLLSRIKKIVNNPYLYRKSIYFNDYLVRDLVCKGYTIVFRINEDTIEVFGFVRFQQNPID